jgi:hypothetical protein
MINDGESMFDEVLRLLHQTRNISLDEVDSKWNEVPLIS